MGGAWHEAAASQRAEKRPQSPPECDQPPREAGSEHIRLHLTALNARLVIGLLRVPADRYIASLKVANALTMRVSIADPKDMSDARVR